MFTLNKPTKKRVSRSPKATNPVRKSAINVSCCMSCMDRNLFDFYQNVLRNCFIIYSKKIYSIGNVFVCVRMRACACASAATVRFLNNFSARPLPGLLLIIYTKKDPEHNIYIYTVYLSYCLYKPRKPAGFAWTIWWTGPKVCASIGSFM